MTAEDVPHFSFGKNWDKFVDGYFDEGRVAIAKAHMLRFLGLADLKGKYFLDIGCGSGLHSLAALDAGAERIVSFDIDPASVRTTERLKAMRGGPAHWTIRQGSVLDKEFLAQIEPADIVYSWGVLHHTGQMWNAVENASTTMKQDSVFYLALYTTTPMSPHWLGVKKRYNRSSPLRKRWMEYRFVVGNAIVPDLRAFKNPTKRFREYRQSRGMSYMVDVRDWLGGYPYEDAKIEEVLRFCRNRLNLELVDIATGEANTEYLLIKKLKA